MYNITNMLLWMLQGTSGAIAGYITNKYAVNMLFKEYTPFRIGQKVILPYKFGGVIKNRKEKFVEELSELVERDIINGRTIKSQLGTDLFNAKVQNLAFVFLNESIEKSFGDDTISDISGFAETRKQLIKFTENNLRDVVGGLAESISKNIDLSNILNDDEIISISDKIYRMIIEECNRNPITNTMTKNVKEAVSCLCVKDLLSENARKSLLHKTNEICNHIVEDFFEENKNIIQILDKCFELGEINDAVNKFQIKVKEKSISDFANENEIYALSEKLSDKVESYLCDCGKENIKKFILSFIELGRETEFTIYDVLGSEFGEKIAQFINSKLPEIMPYISEWIMKNKDELDVVIEESIDEAIGNMDPNIKKLIISKVREFFLDNVSAKNKVVEKIVSYVESYKMDEQSLNTLCYKLIGFLKEKKIKDIILFLEEKNLINDDNINKICDMFINEYKKYGRNIIEQGLKSVSKKNIGSFVKSDFVKIFNSSIKNKIYDLIIENKNIIKIKLCESISNAIKKKAQEIFDEPAKGIILVLDGNISLKNILTNSESKIKAGIYEGLKSIVGNLDLHEKFLENKNSILSGITNIILDYENSRYNNYKDYKISEVLNSVKNKKSISKTISNELIEYINTNAEGFLKGKVKDTVYKNLIQYDEDEICDLAQKFMGNELKPLSVFGGCLGLFTGLIFGSFFNNVNIYGFYNSFSQGLMSFILMGAIGVLTNVIAITMLFRPYKKSKILSKIPLLNKFALGYIPSHKESLGRSLGNVIDNDILNSSKIQDLLIKNKKNSKEYVVDYIEKSNYNAILKLIKLKKNKIIEFLYNKIIRSLSQDDNIKDIAEKTRKAKTEKFVGRSTFFNFIWKMKENRSDFQRKVADYLYDMISAEKTFEECTSEAVLNKFDSSITNEISNMIYESILKSIKVENLQEYISKYDDEYEKLISKSINELLSENTIESLKDYVMKNAENFVFNDLKLIIISCIKQKLSSEIDGEKNIGSLFNGKIKVLINGNLNKLTDMFIKKLNSAIKNNEAVISSRVKEVVNSNLNFFEKIAYAMAGGDSIVESCVSVAVNNKFPAFIDKKFYEINNMIQNGLDNTIYPMSIKELKVRTDELNVGAVLNNIFENSNNNKELSCEINNLCSNLLNTVLSIRVCAIFNIIGLDNIDNIINKFKEEMDLISQSVSESIIKNKETVYKFINEESQRVIIKKVNTLYLRDVFNGIEKDDVHYAVKALSDTLLNNKEIKENINSLLDGFYEEKIRKSELDNFISEEFVQENIQKFIINLLSNEDVINNIERFIMTAAEEAIEDNFDFIDEDTKKYLTDKITDGIINCTITNSKELISGIQLKEVTYEQIKLMDAKEIHDLFESFAGSFFKKLYSYGVFGAFFGLNLYLPILWAIKENASSRIHDYRERFDISTNK